MKARELRKRLRAKAYREQLDYAGRIDRAYKKLTGEPAARVNKAISCTDYKMNLRVKPVPEAVTRENPEYRKVKNPFGQITNARQKMRGKSIPLI